MGPLYGRLFGQPIGEYFPYLAVGVVVWQLLGAIVNDSTQVFIGAEQYLKQINLPLTIHVLRMVWRNAIIFAHNSIIVLVVLVIFLPHWSWWAPMALLGVMAILLNGMWIGLLLGLLCARFRDITQIIANLMQVAFFLTPVMWRPQMLGRHEWAVSFNPFHHLIEVIRAPLVGPGPAPASWLGVCVITALGWIVTFSVFSRYRSRIAYWV